MTGNVISNTSGERRSMFDVLDDIKRQYGPELTTARLTPEHASRTRRKLFERMKSDVLVQRLLNGAPNNGRGRLPRNTAPWMALAEQRMWSGLIGSDMPMAMAVHPLEGQDDNYIRASVAARLLFCQTYLWSKKVFDVIKACPMPSHVIDRDLLPFPFTFHSTEVSYGIIPNPEAPYAKELPQSDLESDWLAIFHCHDGMELYRNLISTNDGNTNILLSGASIAYGQNFPDDLKAYSQAPTAQVLSMLAFLRSPYVTVESHKLPRQWRRHGELAPGDDEKTVNVVVLRRAAQDAVAAYESEPREWKHRWWVAGHFRSQWYPGRHAHDVIWIAPYLKGPESAPMLEKVYTVRR